MSLLEDLKAVEAGYNGMNPWIIEDADLDLECVSDENTHSGRWTQHSTAVFKRGDEYVALDYESPLTEMQEGQDSNWSFYTVKPVTKTIVVTEYVKE